MFSVPPFDNILQSSSQAISLPASIDWGWGGIILRTILKMTSSAWNILSEGPHVAGQWSIFNSLEQQYSLQWNAGWRK